VRPVSLGMNVTVDGFVAGPAGELDWIYPHIDADLLTVITGALTAIDTMLMGRVNYEEQAAHWPSQTDPIAHLVNNHTKVVFSTTLHAVDWVNSRLATSDPAEEIAHLRQQEGGTIGVSGGPTFAAGLLKQGLIDELPPEGRCDSLRQADPVVVTGLAGAHHVRTVLGDVTPDALAITNSHDHLFLRSPRLPGQELDDPGAATAEGRAFAAAGGRTIVQWTPPRTRSTPRRPPGDRHPLRSAHRCGDGQTPRHALRPRGRVRTH